jgi:hypothetical protein
MPGFNLQDYEPVEDRLSRFWEEHPNGRIRTEILSSTADSIVMQALIFRDAADTLAAATGHAQEKPGEGMVNKTSWVENCETSAIGRALANLGYAPKGGRASREEMDKVVRQPAEPKPKTVSDAQQKRIVIAASEAGVDDETRHRITRMFAGVTSSKDVPVDRLEQVIQAIRWYGKHTTEGEQQLTQWEAENLPTTAAQKLRDGSARPPGAADQAPRPSSLGADEGGEHILTSEQLEAGDQSKYTEQVIPS